MVGLRATSEVRSCACSGKADIRSGFGALIGFKGRRYGIHDSLACMQNRPRPLRHFRDTPCPSVQPSIGRQIKLMDDLVSRHSSGVALAHDLAAPVGADVLLELPSRATRNPRKE